MPRKKSLAEELAELSNPAPAKEIDPEADIFDSGPVLEASDDEIIDHVKPRGKEKPRLRGDITIEEKEYSGKKSSRKDIFGSDDDQEDDNDEDGDEDDMSQSEESDDSEDGSEDGSEESDDEDDDNDINNHAAFNNNDEEQTLDAEYRAMQTAEAMAMTSIHERSIKERKKAIAVRAQKSLWNSGLELRILLQKALQGANKLPQPPSHPVIRTVDEELYVGLEHVARDARHVVDDLLNVLVAIEENNPAMTEAAADTVDNDSDDTNSDDDEDNNNDDNNNKKRKKRTDALWMKLDRSYQRFIPYRDASINRWHRKTMLTSGTVVRSGLKALNQSISSQVNTLMQDSERLIERSRMSKRQRTVLCHVDDDDDEKEDAENGDGDGAEDDVILAVHEDRDPETYDDTDFYQALLKEFLESKGDSGGANWYSGPKQRKLVDRRASKGRKLRYHIHEKLVNFMAPTELQAPQYASNIFANLFGGAVEKA